MTQLEQQLEASIKYVEQRKRNQQMTTQAIEIQKRPALTKLDDDQAAIMERVLVVGDLSRLDARERTQYYRAVCASVGLNPLTKPFEYIQLNGKLTLYSTKNCTDQLRQIQGVSVTIVNREHVGDMFVVTARATKADGRSDEDVGAVFLPQGKGGENAANAIMKAHTKAKRRVTLSICGLSFLDESELETTPARRVNVDHETGEVVSVGESLNGKPPQISPYAEEDYNPAAADPPRLMQLIKDAEALMMQGEYVGAREMLGSRAKVITGSAAVEIQKEKEAGNVTLDYHRELSKNWLRVNRQLEKREKAPPVDVAASFMDEDDERAAIREDS